jgi:predicted RNA-binding protein Jag
MLDVAKMERHQKFLEKHLPMAEKAVEEMQTKIENGDSIEICLTKHENKRSFERAISNRQVMEVIECGYVIEYQGKNIDSIDVLMMGYVKISNGSYRPLHVALNIKDNVYTVKTVYDPRSKAVQWSNNYETRLFFVQKEEKVC